MHVFVSHFNDLHSDTAKGNGLASPNMMFCAEESTLKWDDQLGRYIWPHTHYVTHRDRCMHKERGVTKRVGGSKRKSEIQ